MILFGGTDMYTAKMAKLKAIVAEVEQYTSDYVLGVDVEKTVEYPWRKHRFEMPIIYFDKKVIVEQGESGNGVYVKLSIPYEGSREVLAIRPTMSQGGCPDAEITASDFRIKYTGDSPRLISGVIERNIRTIENTLRNAANDLKDFDTELQGRARTAIQQRRNKFQSNKRIVEDLGIPILRREQSPPTYPAPELRRKPPVAPPLPDRPGEPAVELAEYEHILEIIASMVKVMECSPKAFAHMDEEDLRDHILVHLNGHYQGQATGETFNAGGKTDILVRVKDANLFIAECKFWDGKKYYLDSMDQLLGYVTWRDTKTAIIIFNRQKKFSAVLAQIPAVTKEHPSYKSEVDYKSDTRFRFVMKNANDPEKEFLMTVTAFDVPT